MLFRSELFTIISPVIRDETLSMVDQMGNMAITSPGPVEQAERSREVQEENTLVSKLVHLLDSEDDEVVFEMLSVARMHLSTGGPHRVGSTLIPVVFMALKLATRIHAADQKDLVESQAAKQDAILMDKDEAPEDSVEPAPVEETEMKSKGVIMTDAEEESEASNIVAPESETVDTPQEAITTEVAPEEMLKNDILSLDTSKLVQTLSTKALR